MSSPKQILNQLLSAAEKANETGLSVNRQYRLTQFRKYINGLLKQKNSEKLQEILINVICYIDSIERDD